MTRFIVLIAAVAILAATQLTVNAQPFKTGDMVVNAGAGFGWYGYAFGATSLPALSISVEKGIKDIENVGPLSIGGIVGFKHASYAWSSAYNYSWNDFIVAARGGIHYDLLKNEKIDTYGGAALGIRAQSYNYYDGSFNKVATTTMHPLFAFYLGGRYYFTDQFAGFGELGYGLGYLTLGISYKIIK